jgi:hypothetical protein
MNRKLVRWKVALGVAAALALFGAGFLAGANTFEKPKSIIHFVAIKWTAESTPEQRKAAIEGVEKMASEIPGIKRIWVKPIRVQPRDFTGALAIEFEDQAAADRYAKHPAHDAWYKIYIPVRDESRSFQVTN